MSTGQGMPPGMPAGPGMVRCLRCSHPAIFTTFFRRALAYEQIVFD